MSAIRVGVVGIGGRGQNYLRWLSEVDRRSYLGADRHWSHTKRTSYWGTVLRESRDIAYPGGDVQAVCAQSRRVRDR